MTRQCPTCGTILVRPTKVGGEKRQAMYDYIAKHPYGVTRGQIINHVYQDDPNGGPENPNIVPVTVKKINEVLRAQGRRVKIAATLGPGAVYKLERTPDRWAKKEQEVAR